MPDPCGLCLAILQRRRAVSDLVNNLVFIIGSAQVFQEFFYYIPRRCIIQGTWGGRITTVTFFFIMQDVAKKFAREVGFHWLLNIVAIRR
jgi:hypothetical protein